MIVDGVRFLHPKFYFSRKRVDRESDKRDWDGIFKFFKLQRYMGYPYNSINLEQWGNKWVLEHM